MAAIAAVEISPGRLGDHFGCRRPAGHGASDRRGPLQHHHRRHARFATADGRTIRRPSARKFSPPATITAAVSDATRGASGCRNAPTPRRRGIFAGGEHPLVHSRHARHPARQPRPRYGTFAPIFSPNGVAAFGRDFDSSRQVWSKHEGYPGDPRYRDFYRDIGFDLDFDYVKPHLPSPDNRGFTGIKYFRITGKGEKQIYQRDHALAAASEHARHFLDERISQVRKLEGILDRPPIIVAPYDAELFGHWWYEGPEFLDFLVRKLGHEQKKTISLSRPANISSAIPRTKSPRPAHRPGARKATGACGSRDERVDLSASASGAGPDDRAGPAISRRHGLQARALKQAARELLLAQASDWPFILRAKTSPEYARRRVKDHLLRFIALHEQLTLTRVDEQWLAEIESRDNLFPDVDWNYWK